MLVVVEEEEVINLLASGVNYATHEPLVCAKDPCLNGARSIHPLATFGSCQCLVRLLSTKAVSRGLLAASSGPSRALPGPNSLNPGLWSGSRLRGSLRRQPNKPFGWFPSRPHVFLKTDERAFECSSVNCAHIRAIDWCAALWRRRTSFVYLCPIHMYSCTTAEHPSCGEVL